MTEPRYPDEIWTDADGRRFWRPSTVGEDRWIVIAGQDSLQPPQDAPGRPEGPKPTLAAAAMPATPLTRPQRIREAMNAVLRGSRDAIEELKSLMERKDDANGSN